MRNAHKQGVRMLAISSSVSALLFASGAAAPASGAQNVAPAGDAAAKCGALVSSMAGKWPEAGTRIASAQYHAAGPAPAAGPPGAGGPPVTLPAHCEVVGVMHERTGVDGQHYAIRFHLRLPEDWNGRFFMQGGGGTNGVLGDAVGNLSGGAQPALAQGYAVLSQDSGHDNTANNVPERGGTTAFGFDPQARAEYGGTSLPAVTRAAKALVAHYYGAAPRFSYFVGCSKGGQEGMMLAQRYPELYDGIVAASPGFSLPRAAVAEAWDTQSFAEVVRAGGQPLTAASLGSAFSTADFALVRQGVLDACDADDGLKDGIVGAFAACSTAKVMAALSQKLCKAGKQQGCLSQAQLTALRRTHDGPRDGHGKPIYASFPWDAGWGDMGWRVWKTGAAEMRMPPINVAMGAPALASVFTVPPKAVGVGADAALAYALGFDMARDAAGIYASGGIFTRSAWQDIGARSTDLAAFARRGGRMIVPQGASDPVFSISDTAAWWNDVNARSGDAARFVRLFPVPGMGHCSGGPATDGFDAFGSLVRWVEQGQAPDRIEAIAGRGSPWPGRGRPLCPYPLIARPKPGADDMEKASAFVCAKA